MQKPGPSQSGQLQIGALQTREMTSSADVPLRAPPSAVRMPIAVAAALEVTP